MKTLSQHINEALSGKEEPVDKIVLQNLSWEEASEMINKSGRNKESLEYNIGYAEYYAALMNLEKSHVNGYNYEQSKYYLEKAESILDDRAFAKNQKIRRELKHQYLKEVFTIANKWTVETESYKGDRIQKFMLSYRYRSGIDFEVTYDPSKSSNNFTISCIRTLEESKPMKLTQVSTMKDMKKKIDTYIAKIIG